MQFNLSTAPRVNVAIVDNAKMTYTDSASTLENYLDIEILASIVPNSNITLYYAPNSFQSFYNVNPTSIKHIILTTKNIPFLGIELWTFRL